MFSNKILNKDLLKPLLAFVLFVVMSTGLVNAQSATTSVSMELRRIPTTLVVTAPSVSQPQDGGVNVQFTATAKYSNPFAPDRDVTNDSLTAWSSTFPGIAMVTTSTGLVTPVLAGTTSISATYGGMIGQLQFDVTGAPVAASGGGSNSLGGGAAGGSSSGATESNSGSSESQITPPNNPVVSPPVNNVTPPNNVVVPSESNLPDNVVQPSNLISQPEFQPSQNVQAELPKLVFDQPIESPYLPAFKPVEPQQIKPVDNTIADVTEPTGVSRAFVTARIADKLNLLELRKDLLERCFNDLQNCTNIFRMNSNYADINLDRYNLRLFPDLENVVQKDKINKMALLSVVQGYYALKDAPFRPDKSISNVESLKVLTTVLHTLEKGKPDYVAEKFDYNSLFYQEIYVASLLSKLNELPKVSTVELPVKVSEIFKIAHAISEDGWNIIRNQRTPFIDVRPDLYDNQWYYPIVYNRLCELKMLSCKDGDKVNPDDVPTTDQIDRIIDQFNVYIKDHNLDKSLSEDNDGDGINNFDENNIYFTIPTQADTEKDGLTDGDEINKYHTDPNKVDTDIDGLTDGQEVMSFNTDPTKADTDGDGFTDGVEIQSGSDPLNKNSVPDDVNKNNVSDKWESKYNVEVKNGFQDTDGDGLSDVLEYQNGSDPTKIDSDKDGYTDAEEVLELHSDPNDPASPGKLEDLDVLINNFQYGQLVADPSPMIKGVASASLGSNQVHVQILLRNEFGSELSLGETVTDAKGRFLFIPTIEIKNGTYFLLARSINKDQVKISSPLKIIVDSSLNVAVAKPEKIETTIVTDEALVKDLVLKVDSKDGKPVLYGSLTEFGSRLNVTWQSLVVSSALIADTTDGSFSVKAPDLADGRHTVYIQTIRSRDNAMSKTLKLSFDLNKVADKNRNAAEKGIGVLGNLNIAEFVAKQSWPFWIAVSGGVILFGGVIYLIYLGKQDNKKTKK